jgi:hypothetical protein
VQQYFEQESGDGSAYCPYCRCFSASFGTIQENTRTPDQLAAGIVGMTIKHGWL